MDEWVGIVVASIASFITGFIIALLAPILTERRQRNNKRKEIANLVISDIWGHLVQIDQLETHLLPHLKKANEKESLTWMQDFRPMTSIYSESKFVSLLSQLAILPTECIDPIQAYFKVAEFFSNDICSAMDRMDKSGVINSWDAWSSTFRRAGYNALADLYRLVMKDTRKARTMQRRAKHFSKKTE